MTTRRAVAAVLAGMLAACSAGTPARAPADPVVISGPPACDSCRLQMTLEVKLRDRPEVGRQVVGSPQAVARDSTGRIFHVHGMDASSIHVFAPDGAYVQSVGSRGQAPGEFSYIWSLLVDSDDNLYAFDDARLTVFTPELSVRETKLMPVRVRRTLFTDEGILVGGPLRREDGVGLPLHVLGPELEILRSFGAMEDLPERNWEALLTRRIAPGKDGLVWAHPQTRYQIEEWDPSTGTRHRTFERVVEWFEPGIEAGGLSLDTPPPPRLANAWQDADGLLWTLTAVGDENWREGLVILPGFNDLWIEYPELYYDTHVEVIDPETGRLLLSERVPQNLAGLTNDGLAIGRRYPEGEPYQVDLWRLRLVR